PRRIRRPLDGSQNTGRRIRRGARSQVAGILPRFCPARADGRRPAAGLPHRGRHHLCVATPAAGAPHAPGRNSRYGVPGKPRGVDPLRGRHRRPGASRPADSMDRRRHIGDDRSGAARPPGRYTGQCRPRLARHPGRPRNQHHPGPAWLCRAASNARRCHPHRARLSRNHRAAHHGGGERPRLALGIVGVGEADPEGTPPANFLRIIPAEASLMRRDYAKTLGCAALLFALNACITPRLFVTDYTVNMGSIEAAYVGLARYVSQHWNDMGWFPLWYGGIPYPDTYPPLLHWVVGLMVTLAGVS